MRNILQRLIDLHTQQKVSDQDVIDLLAGRKALAINGAAGIVVSPTSVSVGGAVVSLKPLVITGVAPVTVRSGTDPRVVELANDIRERDSRIQELESIVKSLESDVEELKSE